MNSNTRYSRSLWSCGVILSDQIYVVGMMLWEMVCCHVVFVGLEAGAAVGATTSVRTSVLAAVRATGSAGTSRAALATGATRATVTSGTVLARATIDDHC